MKYWLTLLLLTLSLPVVAEVYKCRLPNGSNEISNSPCSGGSSTVKAVSEEVIPEANRRQAERQVEQMREEAERLESSRRAEEAAERQQQARQEKQQQASVPSASMVQECLHNVERMALDSVRRTELEASCHTSGNVQPVYVPVPYYVNPGYVRSQPVRPQPLPQPIPDPRPTPLPTKPASKINGAYNPLSGFQMR